MQEEARKICPMCCSEIAAKAKKCPYCHHLQSRTVRLLYHPAFAALLTVIPLIAMAIVFSMLFREGEDYEPYKDQIVIVQSEMVYGETKAGDTVAVIGAVRNGSAISWKDVQFQVEFFNAAGKRIDTEQKRDYSLTVPAKQTVPFKVSIRREFPKDQYVKYEVRIVSAKDARSRW
jgi:hypothetical protein